MFYHMTGLHIDTQFTCVCFYILFLSQYLCKKKLPTRTNRIYGIMLLVGGLNLAFDILTVYTITHLTTSHPLINRMAHQIFIGSLDVFIALLCYYVLSLIPRERPLTPRYIVLLMLPVALSLIAVLTGPLSYYNDGKYAYSWGFSANTVYLSIAIYLFLTFYYLLRYRLHIGSRIFVPISIAVGVEIAIALLQLRHPEWLISSLGITLILGFIYVSLANPGEYTEKQTGCLGRYAFQIMLDEKLRFDDTFYVISIFLDNQNFIINTFGHRMSDQMLGRLAKTLEKTMAVPIYHTRSRCLSAICSGSAEAVRIQTDALAALLDQSIQVEHTSLHAQTRIYAIAAPQFFKTPDAFEAIQDHLALQSPNVNPDHQPVLFYGEAEAKALKRRVDIQTLLQKAVMKQDFHVVYQPIYNTHTQTIQSAEALVRLNDTQTLGFISPEEFIPIAEHLGLIEDIGRFVFQEVCAFSHKNDLPNKGIAFMEINLSVIQCMNPNLTAELKAIMDTYHLDPGYFNLEITETAATLDSPFIDKNITALKALGCHFSMDDYGTGYSNLARMTETPYTIIKLDKSLIWPYFNHGTYTQESKRSRVILPSTVAMVNDLGASIVAEGVETKAMVKSLAAMGVDYLQGYYFSRPVPDLEFLEFLDTFIKQFT